MELGRVLYNYTFKVTHDKGTINISTTGYNWKSARDKIMKAEGCPRSALVWIKRNIIKMEVIK